MFGLFLTQRVIPSSSWPGCPVFALEAVEEFPQRLWMVWPVTRAVTIGRTWTQDLPLSELVLYQQSYRRNVLYIYIYIYNWNPGLRAHLSPPLPLPPPPPLPPPARPARPRPPRRAFVAPPVIIRLILILMIILILILILILLLIIIMCIYIYIYMYNYKHISGYNIHIHTLTRTHTYLTYVLRQLITEQTSEYNIQYTRI